MEIITYTAMQTAKDCPEKYRLRYELGYKLRFEKESRSLGSAFHLGREKSDIQAAVDYLSDLMPSTQEQMDSLEVAKVTVRAMLEGYFELYGDESYSNALYEVEFKVPIINPETGAKSKSFMLSGKMDAVIPDNGGWWLGEDKTCAQITRPQIDKLALDTQVTTYVYGGERVLGKPNKGVKYRYTRKPSIKQKQTETLDQYCERLIADYKERPDFYFAEEQLYRSRDDLAIFEQELWDFCQGLLNTRRRGLWYKNTSHCLDYGSCEFLPLCCGKPDAMDLYVVGEKHPELEGGNHVAD